MTIAFPLITSYANAKVYLEYAISQGEGFIAITGERERARPP
jgi:hypothetical protein